MHSSNIESSPVVPLVHADNLSLRFGEAEVYSDLTFVIERGSFASIVGPNGAGKTQLMRTLLGLTTPTSGRLDCRFTMSEVGYVPQKVYVDPSFPITVREFLQTYINPHGLWLNQTLPEVDPEIAIDQLLDRPMGKLSGGQLQRVLLAAVLSTNPQVLFLDEFSAGIDPRGQSELFAYLYKLNQERGISIVMISHDIDITTQYADTALCLNKRLICAGKPHEVFTADTFQHMYGIPLTKLTHVEHHHA